MAGITGPTIRQVDLTKPNPAQPLDFVAEQAQLAQASQLAQALMAQQFSQDVPSFATSPGNPFSITTPNFGGPISKVLDAMRAKQQMEETMKQQQALELATQERTRGEVGNIMGLLKGTPATVGGAETGGGPEGQMAPTGGKPPDFYGAIQAALSGTTPTSQALGKELQKGIPTPADMLQYGQHYDPSPAALGAFQQTGDATKLVGRPKITVENGIVYSTQDGRRLDTTAGEDWGPVTEVAPGIAGQKMAQTGKVQFAPTGTAATGIEKILSEADADTLKKGYAGYLQNVGRMGTVLQLQTDIKQLDESSFGTGAGAKIFVNKLLEAVGAPKLDETAGMEQAQAAFGKLLLGGELKQLYPVTDTDLKIMKNILGSEGMTKRGLERMLGILQTSITREMGVHEKFVENMQLPPGMDRQKFTDRYIPSWKFNPVPTLPGAAEPGGNPWRNKTDAEIQAEIDRIRALRKKQ